MAEYIKREDALKAATLAELDADFVIEAIRHIPAADVRIDEGMAIAMLAGARAIEQNPRKYLGATFVYDCFGENPKEITYHDAARKLREEAEAALAKEQEG